MLPSPAYMKQLEFAWTYVIAPWWWWNVCFRSSLAWNAQRLWTLSKDCYYCDASPQVKKILLCTHLHIRKLEEMHFCIGFFKARRLLLVTKDFPAPPKVGPESTENVKSINLFGFWWSQLNNKHTHTFFPSYSINIVGLQEVHESNHHICFSMGQRNACPVASLRIQCMEYLDIECLASKGCKELVRSVLNQYVQPILSLHKTDLFRNAWSTCWQFNHTPLLQPTVKQSWSA